MSYNTGKIRLNVSKQTIRIVLAEDHKIIREGLKSLIEAQPNMVVIGEAETGRTAIALAEELSPDVIIMDITMPELNGIDATRHITSTLPNIRIIALSMHTDRHDWRNDARRSSRLSTQRVRIRRTGPGHYDRDHPGEHLFEPENHWICA
jgi:chemotaxis response regulator CheB